jgi:diacylglycerol kinase family enzyme
MPQDGNSRQARHAAVVYNPVKVDEAALRQTVAAAAERAGWPETRWYATSEQDPGTGQAKQAVQGGAGIVLAAGGDGTIRAVAEGLRGADVPIALLPSGTGNLLARNMKLTLDRLEESVETAFTGTDRHIDLGIVEMERPGGERETRAFLVMAGIGLDAAMIANTDPELKKRVGWLAYVGGIARSLGGKNYIRLRFRLDDGPARNLRVNTMLIGNCGLLTGNILLLPDAVVDDGVFDIVALRPEGLFGWIQIIVKVVWENGVLRRSTLGRKILANTKEVRTLRYLRGRQIVIRPDDPRPVQLDGDTFGQVVRLRAHVEELALAVRIPREEADALPASDKARAEEQVPV